MRINEILIEEQLDELTAKGVGQGIGKFAGNVVRGTGDFFKGMKSGYQQARAGADAASGGATAPAASGGATAPAAPAASGGATAPAAPAASGGATAPTAPAASGGATAPAASAASGGATAPAASGGATAPAAPAASGPKVTVGQINKVIPTLRTRDLESVKRTVDTAINNKKGSASAAPTAPAPAAGTPNLQVQQGGKKKKPAATPAAPFQLPPPMPGATMQAVEESKFYSKFLNCEI
jgi:hypothetical protein